MKFTIISVAVALFVTVDAQRQSRSGPTPIVDSRICDYQKSGYFFSNLRTHGLDAREYCISIGSELVDVDNNNFASLTQMIVKCLGPGQKAWINSWDGNSFANSPLAIWTGLQSGSGSININIQMEPLFAICFDNGYDNTSNNTLGAPSADNTTSIADSSDTADAPSLTVDVDSTTDPATEVDPLPPVEALDFSVDEYALPSGEPSLLAEEEVSDVDEEAEVNNLFNAVADKVLKENFLASEDAGTDIVPAEIDIDAAKDIVAEDEDIAAANSVELFDEESAVSEDDIQSEFPQMLGYPFPRSDSNMNA